MKPVPGVRWSTPDRISRAVTVRAAISGVIAAVVGLTATYRLLPGVVWDLSVAWTAALVVLAVGYPLSALQKSPRVLTSLATAAWVLAAALTAATGGLRSVNLVVDLTIFSVSATLYRPPLPMFLAVLNSAIIVLPGWWAGHALGDWRAALAVLGSCLATAYYSPVAYEAAVASRRHQRRLQATAAIGRAMTALDLDRILPEIAAETGRLLDAATVFITALRPDEPEAQAWWRAPRTAALIPDTDVQTGCARAAAERAAWMRPAAGPWRPVPHGGGLPPDTVGLAVPYGPQDQPVGAIAVASSVRGYLPTWALDGVGDVADYAALGVQAAALHAESKRQALMDPITHLYNARYLGLRLEEEISRARRRRDPLSLLFVDSDSLKVTNDRYGHQHGDRLVRGLARMIVENVRAEDVAVRYAGGDEFVVILPNTDWPEAAEIADRLRRAARLLPVGPRGEAGGTVSIGVATYPVHALNADDLVARADQAMYTAKSAGKNCVAVYGQDAPLQPQGEPFLSP